MSKKKLIKLGFWYTLGTLLVQGINFLTLPIYTRIISPEVFGQYSLYISWVNLFSLVIGLQISGSLPIARLKYKDDYDKYSAHGISISFIFFLLILFTGILFGDLGAKIVDFPRSIFFLILIQSFSTYVMTYFGNYFIQKQRAMTNLLLSLFSVSLSVILSLTFIWLWENDFFARVIGQLLPSLAVAIFAMIYLLFKGKSFIRTEYLYFSFSISLPLIFHQLGHQLLSQLDRIMIGRLLGNNEVALYSFGYNLGLIIQVILLSLNTTWTPWFFEERRKNTATLKNTINMYLQVGLFLTLGYLTIYPEVAIIMGGQEYSSSISFIPLIIVSYFLTFLYTFPVNIQFYYENTTFIPVGTILAAMVNAALNLLLIPRFGIYGAAIATVLSYFVLLLLHHFISYKKYKYDDVSLKQYFLQIGMVSLYSILTGLLSEKILFRYLIGIVIVIGYYLKYRKNINELFLSKIKRRYKV
ncbi:TPA: oligosaccharide flippase family protein [Streptococcus suis]